MPALLKPHIDMKSVRQLNKMVVAKKYIIDKYFDGPPKETDLKMVEETLPPIKQGGTFKFEN